jgi:hypothetical protein
LVGARSAGEGIIFDAVLGGGFGCKVRGEGERCC